METTRLYHNPRCSKSRGALELLRGRGIEPVVVEYLQTPPTTAEIRQLLALLHIPARALLRTGEAEYAQLGLADESLHDDQLIAAMSEHPRLIERPIFLHDGRAVIARPPERVYELLD
jgi:arsenate reductase